jgi:hypothetical protein
MKFRLTYRGILKPKNSSTVLDKQLLRRHFHEQLKALWRQQPLNEAKDLLDPEKMGKKDKVCLLKNVGPFQFAPLVSSVLGWNAIASIEILFLRPIQPGTILGHGGDLDNRIKTLMDCLRIPTATELPKDDSPKAEENPFYVLLEDDALLTGFAVVSDRLLTPARLNEVELVIYVHAETTRRSMKNSMLG